MDGRILKCFLLFTGLAAVIRCVPDPGDDPIPYLPFSEIVINLNLPAYTVLKTDGGSMTIDGGVRGIILYRQNTTTYLAYERNCSFQPTEACATVDIDISTLYMFDPCCGSSFSFANGSPIGGVAWRPLRRYKTSLNAEMLTITDEIVE
jgi:nitrite reductase/ring-hydroxylating ferredoxin subunit